MDCAQVARDELVEKYLNGQLESPLERELQVHLLECHECLALVETCEAARDELAARAAVLSEIPEKPIRGMGRSWPAWLTSVRTAALAGLAVTIVAAVIVSRSGLISGRSQHVKSGSGISNKNEPRERPSPGAGLTATAILSSADDREAVARAMNSRTISYPPDLASLRGKTGTLLGGTSQEDQRFRVLDPVGEVIIDVRPVFRWQALAGASNYSVVLLDDHANLVQSSPPLAATQWTPPQPLKHGQVYEWQVTAAMSDGKSVIAPSFPRPKAKFRVIDEAKANEIERLRKDYPDAHLILGILYAHAGALKEGEQELAQVPATSPDFDLAQHLLRGIRQLR